MASPIKRKNPGWASVLLTRMKSVAGREIAVGFPRGECNAYPDGESVAQVAYDNVNGIHAPVRDFMAYADPEIKQKTRPILRELAKQVNKGNERAVAALSEAAGLAGAQAVKAAIIEGDYPPNSPATIARKKSDRPLVDTGHMVQSATHVVRDKSR